MSKRNYDKMSLEELMARRQIYILAGEMAEAYDMEPIEVLENLTLDLSDRRFIGPDWFLWFLSEWRELSSLAGY